MVSCGVMITAVKSIENPENLTAPQLIKNPHPLLNTRPNSEPFKPNPVPCMGTKVQQVG
jgi:hypothetical protein